MSIRKARAWATFWTGVLIVALALIVEVLTMPKNNDYDLPVLPDSKYAVAFICKATPPAEDLFHLYFVDKVGYVEDNSEIIEVDGTLWYKGNLYTLGQTADYENPDNIDPDKLLYGEHYVFAKTAEAVEAFGSEYPGLNTESWVEVEWDDFTEGGAPEGAAFAVAAEYNGPHWSNVTLLDQYGNVFIEGSNPIDVVAAARRRYSYTLGYLMGVCAPPLKLPDKQPTAYSYNGVVLPKLPEWDKTVYPYALLFPNGMGEIVSSAPNYYLYLFVTPNFGIDEDTGTWCFFADARIPHYKNSGWGEFSTESGKGIYDAVDWANFDIPAEDGTIFLAASDPIPVYE